MKNKGGSVFPILDTTQANDINSLACIEGGMDLRDYFAGQVLAGLCVNRLWKDDTDAKDVTEHAYRIADAMLVKRDKEQ